MGCLPSPPHFFCWKKTLVTMELFFTIVFVSLLCGSLCSTQQERLYVKPSEDTPCPPDGSPCKTLQEYVDNSDFTSNRLFLFLRGKHYLESFLDSRGFSNLSLVGESYGVQIECNSNFSRIDFFSFERLVIEKIAVVDCPLFLYTGSDAHLSDLEVYFSIYGGTILNAYDVSGTCSIVGSTFFIINSVHPIVVIYTDCSKQNNFIYSNNTVYGGNVTVSSLLQMQLLNCNVNAAITDSSFEGVTEIPARIQVDLCGWTDTNSLLIGTSIFTGVSILIEEGYNGCSIGNYCTRDCIVLDDLAILSSDLTIVAFVPLVLTVSGSALLVQNSKVLLSSNCRFHSNTGIALQAQDSEVIFNNTCTFDNNTGTGIQAQNSEIVFSHCAFKSNVGTAIQAINSVVSLNNSCSFESNIGTVIQVIHSTILLNKSCTFENNIGAAIQAINSSEITFQGHSTFKNNSDTFGGALQLRSSSYMHLMKNSSILFADNHANYVGGAIYIDHEEEDGCFFQSSSDEAQVTFVNNTASYSGSALYGNGISLCCNGTSCSNFEAIFDFSRNPFAIGSDPYKVCLCDKNSGLPNCSLTNHSIEVFPGQEFSLHLAVVGNFFDATVPGSIGAFFNSRKIFLQRSQTFQKAENTCMDLKYSVNSTEDSEMFSLTIEESFIASITDDNPPPIVDVTVHLNDCPQGFNLSTSTRGCECDSSLKIHSVQCNINNNSFLLPPNSWMGFNQSCSGEKCVVFTPNCPIGYCSPDYVSASSDDPDKACASHRTGVVCSKCKGSYSLALGNQACMECSHFFLLLIIPMALAGLLLVGILFALNLTVTEGTINGLLFYANVIGLHHRALFVQETSYFYPFLAWINLDFGISTCLYHGMDHYQETWLQFVFPIYLWTIILVIVQLHKKFPSLAAKLIGNNSVPVLATLLLMSFTKLIRTVAIILSSTKLDSDEVWLYDATHKFFKGSHIYLGTAGLLVLVFLIIPYALCVTFFQQFQACSGHRLFRWVNRLKPIFDAYAGPYKDKYRFWTGMLLLVRTSLAVSFNCTQSLQVNLFITVITSFGLAMISSHGIYKKWPCNFLEILFYCQLGAFAAGITFFKHLEISITPFADVSIGLSFIVFLCIVGYHVYDFFKGCHHRKGYKSIVPPNDMNLVESKIP